MGKRLTMVFVALAGLAAGYLLNGYGVSAQQSAQHTTVPCSFAAPSIAACVGVTEKTVSKKMKLITTRFIRYTPVLSIH